MHRLFVYLAGMEVLEEQLIQEDEGGGQPVKRGRHEGTTVSQDVPLWIELARSSMFSSLTKIETCKLKQ